MGARVMRWGLIGLWLAIAFFIEAIEWPVLAIGKSALLVDRITSYLDFEAKLGSVPLRIGEDIVIIEPKVGVSFADQHLLKILYGNIETAPNHCGTPAYHRATRGISICKIKIGRNVSSIDANPPTNTIRPKS